MVATTSGSLNSLYPALIITLSNSAPYFMNLTVMASSRLLQLFTSFSNPSFLLSDEGHPRLLFFMLVPFCGNTVYPLTRYYRLEAFNSVIHHHLSENANLTYGILSSHKKFEELGTFTLARGLREIRRVQLAREEQARRVNSHDEASDDAPSAHNEKARLSENDGSSDTPTRPEVGTSPQSREDHGETTPRSATPLTAGATSQYSSEHELTEKARGKMKERRSSSLDMNPSLERLAAAGIGRNGFVPTQEWVSNFQNLPTAYKTVSSTRSHPGNRGNVMSMLSTDSSSFSDVDYLWTSSCWLYQNCYQRYKNYKRQGKQTLPQQFWSCYLQSTSRMCYPRRHP